MKSTKKWLKRIGILLLTLIVVALITGVIYEQVGRQKMKKYEETRTGRFVDVGGHKLYYYSKGAGKPTVVFESGFPGSHMAWSYSELFNEVSEYATAVCYNRAGILWSERGTKAKTSENMSDDLYALLENGGFSKPYILVGHSAAGIYLRPFIKNHEKDILGVILLDPSHPDQMYLAPDDIKDKMKPPFMPTSWLLDFANNTGIARKLSGDPLLFHSIKSGAIYDGMQYLYEETSKKTPETTFGNVPLLVVSAGSKTRMVDRIPEIAIREKTYNYWDSLQTDIVNSATNGRRIVSEKSTHNDIMDIEKDLIISEILQLIQKQENIEITEQINDENSK